MIEFIGLLYLFIGFYLAGFAIGKTLESGTKGDKLNILIAVTIIVFAWLFIMIAGLISRKKE